MEQSHYCPLCRERQDRQSCKCTPEQLDRWRKERELEDARATVARLERELGGGPAPHGNRYERRSAKARSRRGR